MIYIFRLKNDNDGHENKSKLISCAAFRWLSFLLSFASLRDVKLMGCQKYSS